MTDLADSTADHMTPDIKAPPPALNQAATKVGRTGIAGLCALLFLNLGLSACATITEGSAQTIRIETEPAGARCELTRDGTLVTRIPATPATISLFKEKGELALTCNKPGYLEGRLDEASGFQNMMLGNILIGGLIGVVIDAGSGAMYKYPESVRMFLIPEHFDDAADRDRFFDALQKRVEQETLAAIAAAREGCAADDCSTTINGLKAAGERQLQQIEQQRLKARIHTADR